jgi:hypothetical protein
MIHNLAKRLKATIVIETSFCPDEESVQRSRSIPAIRRAIGLKIVYADLGAGMHWPARLSEQRGSMACRTFPRTLKDPLADVGKFVIVKFAGGLGAEGALPCWLLGLSLSSAGIGMHEFDNRFASGIGDALLDFRFP